MIVQLINKPSATGDIIAGLAAGTCTNSADWKRSLKGSMASGHESVAEHASYTFRISGVSRVLLAQLTRHRIASYSVQSQRYCTVNEDDFIIPETIKDDALWGEYIKATKACTNLYYKMIDSGIPREDARYILPQGTTTVIILTMNARELRHFFSLRCCNRAQWEIRKLADAMLALVQQEDPILFKDAGPGCVRGRCPEGSRSCGKPRKSVI